MTSKKAEAHRQMVAIHNRNRPANIDDWPAKDRAEFLRLLAIETK
jgi:hypothetical protein